MNENPAKGLGGSRSADGSHQVGERPWWYPSTDGREAEAPAEGSKSDGDTAHEISAARLGWFPVLSVFSAGGLILIVAADALSRSTRSSSQTLFWVGLLVIVAPIVFRIASAGAGRIERLSLTVLLGLSLYLVKVLHDPFGFTYADELVHAGNANAIVRTQELFHVNPVLPVTAYYPGLESVAAALTSMSGLSAFGAGVIVIGAARAVIMLALFLLFERLTGSSRIAALGAAIYTANANFLFWSAQFSYESLALPLLVMILFAVSEWRDSTSRTKWAVVILLATVAVVATHHISSYALDASLLMLCLLAPLAVGRDRLAQAPWPFALFALAGTVAWLVLVASKTVGYLTPVFHDAFVSTIHTVSGEAGPRKLFTSDAGAQAPGLERLIGLGSIVVLAAGFPFGLRALWRRYRRDPFAIMFAIAGAAFFGTVVLRLAPGAWETANRASEFLFLGLAFVLALVGLDRWSPRRAPWLGPALTAACFAVVFAGGVISGWSRDLRLSQPYRVRVGAQVIDAEGRQMARWVEARLGHGKRFAASESNARLLKAYAQAFAIPGRSPDIVDVLQTPTLQSWELPLLREHRLRYVVVDRRLRSFNAMGGYYFGVRAGAGEPDTLLSPEVVHKFDRIEADRLYDSGNIVVFDRGLEH